MLSTRTPKDKAKEYVDKIAKGGYKEEIVIDTKLFKSTSLTEVYKQYNEWIKARENENILFVNTLTEDTSDLSLIGIIVTYTKKVITLD